MDLALFLCVLQLNLSDQFFNGLIFYFPLPRGVELTKIKLKIFFFLFEI